MPLKAVIKKIKFKFIMLDLQKQLFNFADNQLSIILTKSTKGNKYKS